MKVKITRTFYDTQRDRMTYIGEVIDVAENRAELIVSRGCGTIVVEEPKEEPKEEKKRRKKK